MSIAVNSSNFQDEVLGSRIPVLVDFWASWCGPCRMLAPTLEELASKYEGKIKVCKVNVDEEPVLAARFNVASIPTLIVFKDGKMTAQSLGVQPLSQLEALLGL